MWDGDVPVSQWFADPCCIATYRDLYGMWGGHNGIDLALPVGTPLYAPDDGVVRVLPEDGGYGNRIKLFIAHGPFAGGMWTIAHLSEFRVPDQAQVSKGTLLGLSGGRKGAPGAGFSSCPHAHIGLRPPNYDDGNGWEGYVSPEAYMADGTAAAAALPIVQPLPGTIEMPGVAGVAIPVLPVGTAISSVVVLAVVAAAAYLVLKD